MKITKYEHACFTVELDGKTLIVDPGIFTKSMEIPTNVVAIIVTHEHEDHFNPDMLAAIYDKNPDSILVSVPAVVDKMPDHHPKLAEPGKTEQFGPFSVQFFGGKHAEIHSSMPLVDNVGILVNEKLYYPGDSFVQPYLPVELLALPTSGPWQKTGEVIDFITAVHPKKAFSTHDVHNSEEARALVSRLVGSKTQTLGIEYVSSNIGDEFEI